MFTVIPRSASASARLTVIPASAALEAAYASSPVMGPSCCPEVNSTTLPPGRPSCRAANAWTSSRTARALTAKTASSSAAVSSPSPPSLLRAWLQMTTSTWPYASTAASSTRSGACGSRKSTSRWATRPPSRPAAGAGSDAGSGAAPRVVSSARTASMPPGSAPQGWSRSCAVHDVNSRSAPRPARRLATAIPMPTRRLTPVTIATRPASGRSVAGCAGSPALTAAGSRAPGRAAGRWRRPRCPRPGSGSRRGQ